MQHNKLFWIFVFTFILLIIPVQAGLLQWNATFDDASDLFITTGCAVAGGTLTASNNDDCSIVHPMINMTK